MKFLRLLSAQDALFPEAFALYEASFPAHERRRWPQQAALMPHSLYHFDVIVSSGVLVGIVLYWAGTDHAYVEHFAVHPAMRGRAMGSRILSAFCARHPLVVLEIDPPVDDIAQRRERFYQRLGFLSNPYPHVHPAYRQEYPPHPLVVLSHPRALTAAEYETFARALQEVVMNDAPF